MVPAALYLCGKHRIGSALVALVAVDIFEPEEFSVVCVVQCFALLVCVVQCFALHLLAPHRNKQLARKLEGCVTVHLYHEIEWMIPT
jgi:cell division protein FtsL